MNLKRVFSRFRLMVSFSSIIMMVVFFIRLKHDGYTRQRTTSFQKSFIYLTQTEQCLPSNLASSSQIGDPETCNCDVIVLSYRAKCQADNTRYHVSYLFDPNTLFASGRNLLFFDAVDRSPGYHYYIFLDDDVVLKYNTFTPADMTKLSPFRVLEKWLLDYEPAVGVLDYEKHNGAKVVLKKRRDLCGIGEISLVLPTVRFDAILNAFHHKAIKHILPYPTQNEVECIYASNRNTMLAVEIKFPGQALLFAPITASNPLHRDYPRSKTNITEIMRKFIERIRQEAPLKLRNHVIFEQLHKNPGAYLTKQSRSVCVNVTRRQPIIPYKHLLNEL